MKYEKDKDVSKYATCFKRIYKRVDPYKSTLNKTIVKKFINLLSSKFMKLLIIIGPTNLNEIIKAALDIKIS